jgi:hypothetical protein
MFIRPCLPTLRKDDPATDAIIEIASIDLVKGGGVANARSTYVVRETAMQARPELMVTTEDGPLGL